MLELTRLRFEASPLPISWVQTGFFAGGSPTVEELLQEAEASDCDCIVVQPHLLFEGQLSVQLRAMVDTYRQAGSKKRWLVAPTLGADPKLADTFLALGLKAILSISSNGS
jgi:sirohydrochlorin ferrochelatase